MTPSTKTKLVATLCFYDEDPAWLRDMVISLRWLAVDTLVAADGAYAIYPDGKSYSGIEQHAALIDACQDAGIRLDAHVPTALWADNEREKRTHLFRMADEHQPDWLAVIDADEVILTAPHDFEARLAATDADYAECYALNDGAPVVAAGVEGGDPQIMMRRFVKRRRCFFRWHPGLHIGDAHDDYVTGDGRNLWGDPDQPEDPPLMFTDVVMDHRNHLRAEVRAQRMLDYYDVRNGTGAEKIRARPWSIASDEKVAETNALLGKVLEPAE